MKIIIKIILISEHTLFSVDPLHDSWSRQLSDGSVTGHRRRVKWRTQRHCWPVARRILVFPIWRPTSLCLPAWSLPTHALIATTVRSENITLLYSIITRIWWDRSSLVVIPSCWVPVCGNQQARSCGGCQDNLTKMGVSLPGQQLQCPSSTEAQFQVDTLWDTVW